MKTYRLEEIRKYDKRPGLAGSFVHGDSMSLTHWKMDKGAVLMEHSHHQEQITFVVSGKIRFERQGQAPVVVEAGGFAVFPSNEPHGGVALEDTVAIDAFSPMRDDFKREMAEQE